MNHIRVWPHAVLIIAGIAIAAAAGVFLWKKYEPGASAQNLPNAARIERVDGQVAVNHSLDNTANGQWITATPNAPISVGDRLYTRENSRTDIAFTGRNFATVDANTSLDVLDLSRNRTQVALREGSSLFDVGSLSSGQLFEVATPCGAIDLQQPGTYRVSIDGKGNATVTAFSGQAQLVGQAGSGTVNKGEVLTVPCGGSAAGTISRVDYDQAGSYLDSYYRYRYPKRYDGRYRNYYTYLDDPYYYDPYRNYSSYNYVSEYIPGIYDLDDYGDWRYVSDYGYVWHPRVDAGWAPYEYGSWAMDYPYGLTWISTEPWGYAPYHYGRWAYASNDWYWVPDSTYYYPTYSPALTAFIPMGNSSFAWIALGPSDPYVYRYYDPYWQPVYLSSYPTIDRLANIYVPNAVTVIPVQDFGRVIDPTIITRVDPQTIVQYRPVLDPLTVDPLRQAAFSTKQMERRIDVPQTVAQQIVNTPVVTTAVPAPPFKRDFASALKVQQLSGRERNQTLQLNDQRAATAQQGQAQNAGAAANVAAEQAREKQMAELARQASHGDRGARQQMQQLRQQQLAEQRTQRTMNAPAQGQRVGQPMAQQQNQGQLMRQQQQAEREAARQQMITTQQMLRAAEQQQQRAQRGVRQQQAPVMRNAPQPQQVRPQVTRPQPQVERHGPPQMRPQSQPRVMSAPRQQSMPQQEVRPQVERRGPPQMRPQPQAQPQVQRPQPQAQPHPQPVRPQPQAQPRPAQAQPQAQPRPAQAQPQARPQGGQPKGEPPAGKGGGNPKKKPSP